MNTIVHPNMMRMLEAFFNNVAAIGNIVKAQDANSGEEIKTFVVDPLMQSVRCYVEPMMNTQAGGSEIRRSDQTIVERAWTIALDGYFATISVEDRATIGLDNYNILNVMHDDTNTITFLTAEIVNAL
jgi:hypothetical protein